MSFWDASSFFFRFYLKSGGDQSATTNSRNRPILQSQKMQSSQFLLIPHLLLSSHRQQLSEHRRHPYRLSFRYLISTADNSPIRNTKERLINDISVPKSTPLTRDQEQKSKKDGDQQKKKIKKNDQKIGGFDIEEENFIDKNVGRFDFG